MITSDIKCNCISSMEHQCIEFSRSSASFGDVDCRMGVREQLNMQTAFLDASHIYGIDDESAEELRDRSRNRGQLKVQHRSNGHKPLLPADPSDKPEGCLDFSNDKKCFIAGILYL